MRSLAFGLSSYLLLSSLVVPASAQQYPTEAIRVVVPFGAGGTTDLVARLISQKLSERLKQPVVVENKPGGGSIVGIEAVVSAPPNGYTLLYVGGSITIDPSYRRNLSYDYRRDLIPITKAAGGGFAVLIHSSLPIRTIGELIAYSKSNPGKLNFGSPGVGSSGHLAQEYFKSAAGIDMTHIPYRGGAQAGAALMANEVQVYLDGLLTAKPMIDSGRARVLAVTSKNRSPLLPDVPTADEAGLKDFEADYWGGFLAPAKTPKEIIDKLNKEIVTVLHGEGMKEKLLDQGLNVYANSQESFREELDQETAKWSRVIRAAGIEPE
jgi:tripartite-type tricarboxylate transporter receptor subunit TctC